MVTNKALLSNAIFALWLPKNDAPEWLFVCSGDATKSDAFQLAQAKKWPVLAVDLLMSYPAALPKGLVQTCSKHQALGLIYNLLYPCSPWYDASDEWLFVCSGDATQSDVFPISHLENTSPWACGPRAGSTWSSARGSGPTLPQTSGFNP